MDTLRALLYLAAIVLLVLGAMPIRSRVFLALLGAAAALTAYALPALAEAG